MSMQVCCVEPQSQQVELPPSDLDKMKTELFKIDLFMKKIELGEGTEVTYADLKTAITVVNEIILSVDNANDFFKIGGFNQLVPLLSYSDAEVVAAVAELIADLCQNNKFCQSKSLDLNIMPQLVKLMDVHPDEKVCLKALYALSCLCRNNDEAIKYLEITNFLPVLLRLLQKPDEKLRTKAAFFLSCLAKYETLRESLFQADMISVLIRLLKERMDSSSEHLLGVLVAQVSQHKQSRIQCRKDEYELKNFLQQKIQFYTSKSEYDECKEHCLKILDICFHDEKK
ncbi:hsp70-binding protein 1-like [Uloborus diversus]|uniref:hsp70-binding protein 1-like n=1 Tax=Uloborus diversus TaxID=327109 RepID=UPI0024092039|nr:hsp70-binding protein 1-like [Uloborus diversus]XP_054707500.1 hsp70-binding protein 1-like [Uloborus diversus]